MKIIKFILPILILVAGVGAYFHFKSSKQERPRIEKTTHLPVVAAKLVERQSVAPTIQIYGRVESPALSVLTAAIDADVQSVSVLEGDRVEKEQQLIQLDGTDAGLEILQRKADVAEIEAQLASDRRKFEADKQALSNEKALLEISSKEVERARKLAQTSAGTQATLDTALKDEQRQRLAVTLRTQSIDDFGSRQKLWQARLEKANAALRRAERDQARASITAPFTGRVVEVMVSGGDRATRGTPLLRMYDDEKVEIRAQIPARYLSQLRSALDQGQPIKAEAENTREALTMHRLSASISTGQGGVDAFFRSNTGLPELGRTMGIILSLPEIENAVLLDTDALYGSDLVYLIQDQVLVSRKVKVLGFRQSEGDAKIIISGEGFSDTDVILSSRLPQAIDGLEVEVAEL